MRRADRPAVRGVRERAGRYAPSPPVPVVVDASMAVLWFANEPDAPSAAQLLEPAWALLAPDLMAVEATNAWWKKVRRHEMDRADVEQAVTNLLALDIAWASCSGLIRPAIRLAIDLQHPVYDCLYLALAASRSAALATADDTLACAAGRVGISIWRPEGRHRRRPEVR